MSNIYPPTEETFLRAAGVLREGGVVGFPTETYYGLAVDPFNAVALKTLFALKHRPANLPILVLVGGIDQCELLTADPPGRVFRALASAYWPGPLTLVAEAQPDLPVELTGDTGTVGMRRSPHPIAEALVHYFGAPVTATSANFSGMPPAVDAAQVAAYFKEKVQVIINGGRTPGKKGSTLLRCDVQPVQCLREGVIPFDSIPQALISEKADHGNHPTARA